MSEITVDGERVGGGAVQLPAGWSGFRVDADYYIRVEDDQQNTYEVQMSLQTTAPPTSTWTLTFDTGW